MNQAGNIAVTEKPYAQEWRQPPTVIVGAGPVGQRLAEELRRHEAAREIVMFGDEPWAPYDRVQLSSWLAGESRGTVAAAGDAHMRLYLGMSINHLDRDNH